MAQTGSDDGSEGAVTFGADAEATAALFARCGVSLPVASSASTTRQSEGLGGERTRVNDGADSMSQAEQDAAHAWLGAVNCLPHEGAAGPELLNVAPR